MQLSINPDAASHSHLGVFLFKLKRFESDDECGNDVARVGRKNRHSYHLIDDSAAGVRVSLDITDLLLVGQSAQSQLRFRFRIQFTHVVGIWRLDDRAIGIEKAIKSRVQRLRCLLRGRFIPFHQIAQFVLCARIQ
jgi:hypothetical protein